jgi:hypothetical protein
LSIISKKRKYQIHAEGSIHSSSSAAVVTHLSPKQRTFLQCLRQIPIDKLVIHDVRLSFTFNHLWFILATSSFSSHLIKNIDTHNNKDIILQDINLGNHVVKTTMHNANTISVIVVILKILLQ